MAWLPMYMDNQDIAEVLSHLNDDGQMAFIVSSGNGGWRAVASLSELRPGRHCLWHVPSGPLPLFRGAATEPGLVVNPFAGWVEEKPGADPAEPYFGAGHPGVIWLNFRATTTQPLSGQSEIGLSSFEWIGNHYKAVGSAAKPATEAYWNALRRWVKKKAVKVPRGGIAQSTPPEIWAFPEAVDLLKQGAKGGNV